MEEVEEMEEVELSSDEEDADEDEVSLIVLKRPPITERVIEEVEVSFLSVCDLGDENATSWLFEL